MPGRIVTLTTDFGLHDHYAGTMKGVLLGLCPTAQIIDITHDISSFGIEQAGFLLHEFYRYFPPRTVHVVVVDPGVGSSRRPILVEAAGQFFVGPDNGVFSMIYSAASHVVREVTASRFFLPVLSNTFHGRDIFAPVAAHLARAGRPARFGPPIQDYTKLTFGRPLRTGKRFWAGSVMRVDRFGNLVTSFSIDEFPAIKERPFSLLIGGANLSILAETFASIQDDSPAVIIGSSGYLEVVCNRASAARKLGCALGSPAELTIL